MPSAAGFASERRRTAADAASSRSVPSRTLTPSAHSAAAAANASLPRASSRRVSALGRVIAKRVSANLGRDAGAPGRRKGLSIESRIAMRPSVISRTSKRPTLHEAGAVSAASAAAGLVRPTSSHFIADPPR